MRRVLQTVQRFIQLVTVDAEFQTDPRVWLAAQARQHGLRYMLIHADDGVIWGRLDKNGLRLSSDVAPEVSPPLRDLTLQQCRLFGEGGELFLWRTDDGWTARSIRDEDGNSDEYFDEDQVLWGTGVENIEDGFTVVFEGQGLKHAVPIVAAPELFGRNKRPLRLKVRHYLVYDDAGVARIALSRLVDVFARA